MAVGQGYVAAGGQNSQLDVRWLAGGEVVYKGHVGGSVNNALHIARDAGHQVGGWVGKRAGGGPTADSVVGCAAVACLLASPSSSPPLLPACAQHSLNGFIPQLLLSLQMRLFVCNNDDTVKVYGLASGALLTMLRCPVAINYCALSPSGGWVGGRAGRQGGRSVGGREGRRAWAGHGQGRILGYGRLRGLGTAQRT
jgi:hypothetical protein